MGLIIRYHGQWMAVVSLVKANQSAASKIVSAAGLESTHVYSAVAITQTFTRLDVVGSSTVP